MSRKTPLFFLRIGRFFLPQHLYWTNSSFSCDCSFSFTIQPNKKKYKIHYAQKYTDTRTLNSVGYVDFISNFWNVIVSDQLGLFSYCFFSLLLLLLSLLFLLLVYSFSLAMLSVRWSTVIGLWLRVLSHNELTITTLFTVAPGCNLICSLSFSRKRYSFQSFWKLIILSSGSLVYSKLPIQSILYNRKYCLNNYLFEFYKFGIPCIIKVCLEHKLLKIGLKCWNVFWCVMKFLSFLLLIDLICLKDFNKILSKLLFICKSSPKFGHPMKRISDFNSLPIWQNHP